MENIKLTLDPGPLAFMILLLMTSAGEQTVVATVPCVVYGSMSTKKGIDECTHCSEARCEVTYAVVLEVLGLEQFSLEEIISDMVQLACIQKKRRPTKPTG